MLKSVNEFLLILLAIVAVGCQKEGPVNDEGAPTVYEGWALTWNDEFDQESIDPDNWNFELGDGTDYGLPSGWGNNELQTYTDKGANAEIVTDDNRSVLAITAIKDEDGNYSSAKLTTRELISVRYGRIEIRAKFPRGKGLHPAIWMLGDNRSEISWPGCGEIDIVEVLGHEPGKMYSTLHYTNNENKHAEKQSHHEMTVGDFSEDYHVISMDWSPETLAFSVDGNELPVLSVDSDMKEFMRSFYLIVNLAVGGNWPGYPDETSLFPQSMYIDYVRVYEKEDASYSEAPALDMAEETVGQYIDPMLAYYPLREGFDVLGEMSIITYGPGQPEVASSAEAIDGEKSLAFEFPGGNWGGGYISLAETADLSSFTNIVFSLQKPAELNDVELKLESPSSSDAVFLTNYTPADLGNGWEEYTIPLSHFAGADFSEISIPFALWNPVNSNSEFVQATVFIDNLYYN